MAAEWLPTSPLTDTTAEAALCASLLTRMIISEADSGPQLLALLMCSQKWTVGQKVDSASHPMLLPLSSEEGLFIPKHTALLVYIKTSSGQETGLLG